MGKWKIESEGYLFTTDKVWWKKLHQQAAEEAINAKSAFNNFYLLTKNWTSFHWPHPSFLWIQTSLLQKNWARQVTRSLGRLHK